MLGITHKQQTNKFSDRKQRIHNFLYETSLGVLSTIDASGDPHGSVIYFAIDSNFHLAFLTKTDTLKYDNLKRNPRVMLTVFEPKSQTTAQISGTAKEITSSQQVNFVAGHILTATLKTSKTGIPPISKLQAGPYAAFEIEPVQIRMAVYARPGPGEYSDLFETLESFDLENP